MKRELKILLIVFGSLFALLVIAVVGLVVLVVHYGPDIAKNATDPVAGRRTADKIATFTMPKGYRVATATDFKFSQVVSIEPVDADSSFRIQLQGTMVPSGNDSQVAGMKMGMGIVSKFANCDLKDDGVDNVVVRGVHVKLNVMQCSGTGLHMRVETGVFPGNAAQATVTAMGVAGNGFDVKALHALLESVR